MTHTSLSLLVAYEVGGSHCCGVGLSTTGESSPRPECDRFAGESLAAGGGRTGLPLMALRDAARALRGVGAAKK